MVGGSADLTGSNNTFVKGMKPFPMTQPDYAGRYVTTACASSAWRRP